MEERATTNRFQSQFGPPSDRSREKVRDRMAQPIQEFIRHAPFAVLATSNLQGECDASPKGGTPGFVRVVDERHLLLPDVKGNRLFQSYENIDANGRVGLIFFIPGLNQTARVNGTAQGVDAEEMVWRSVELSVYEPDENAQLLQGLFIEVEEAYLHCPRALKFSSLWDTGTIENNRRESPV